MPQSTRVQREAVAQVADRILLAWRNGETAGLQQDCELVRWLAAQPPAVRPIDRTSTLEMERMEALSAAAASLGQGHAPTAGAIRLLEHLANPSGHPRG